jgi:hypothetical protein
MKLLIWECNKHVCRLKYAHKILKSTNTIIFQTVRNVIKLDLCSEKEYFPDSLTLYVVLQVKAP